MSLSRGRQAISFDIVQDRSKESAGILKLIELPEERSRTASYIFWLNATAKVVASYWDDYQLRERIMNNSTIKRSEEARRQAQAVLIEAKRRQEQLLEERASMHASHVQKVESLRAQRLARREMVSNAEAAREKDPCRQRASVSRSQPSGAKSFVTVAYLKLRAGSS